MQNTTIVEINLENFQQIILDESKQKLVLTVFWAAQMPESVELKDKLAVAVNGFEEQLILASVDCQTQQQIAQQFGIQALPTAILVKDGQPIDGISGPQNDEAIAQFLDKHLPKAQDNLLMQAKQALSDGDGNNAYTYAMQAYQLDQQRGDIQLALADACLAIGKIAEAKTLLSAIKMIDQDSYYQALIAKLEVAEEAADSPEIKVLEQELAQDPSNVESIQKLAAQYSQVNRYDEALTLLFRQVQSDNSDTESKKLLLDIIKALPDGDPLAAKYRRKLYTLMY
jgi:putative thioredoxin